MSLHLTSRECARARSGLYRIAAVTALLLAAPLLAAAEKSFSIASGDATATLRTFAEQSGEQVVYPPGDVRGIRTHAVSGILAPRTALERMLAGTALAVIFDEKTGALAVRRGVDRAPSARNQPRVKSASAATSGDAGGTVALDTYEVLGRKIDGPANQTIFTTSETGVFNYDIIERSDIERLGVTNMEEFLRFAPQTSDYGVNALQGQVGNPGTAGGATFQNSEVRLRGFSSLQTAILINGRRLQRGNLSAGADLSRIPIAAIERIEILPSSASAIYGGGAIGGAINVVLRKDYTGRDVTAYVGTSTDGGGTEWGLTYFEGRSFNEGRTRLSTTVNYLEREALRLQDRDYLQRAFDRYPSNSSATVSGRPIYEQYIIPAFATSPGTIVINAVSGSLNIPGNPSARFAGIPTGLNASQASALTPASFTGTAGVANIGNRFGRSVLYRPEERYSFNSTLEHTFVQDRLDFYAEVDVNYMRSEYSFPQMALAYTLTATDPLNPFRTNVTPGFVGVPITVYFDPVDLPDPSLFQDRRGVRGVVGFKGKIGDRWEWSLDGSGEYGRSHSTGTNTTQNLNTFINSAATLGLTQAQRRALYNPLADHKQYPAGEAMAPYIGYDRDFYFRNNLGAVNGRVVGDVLDLPAGPLRLSPGFEIIWSQYGTSQQIVTAPEYLANIGGVNAARSYSQQGRRTDSVYLEAIAPLVGPAWRPLPVESIDLNAAVRWEGTDDSTDEVSPTVGLRVGLTKSVAVRVSYAEGFFPPDQTAYENMRVNDQAVTPFTDPFRGNNLYNYPRIEIAGGNPDLLPETSTAWNYGIIFTPQFAPSLTFTADFWKIEKENAIGVINGPSFVVADPVSYPGRVIRAEPTATDIANGWLGAVTSIDWRPVNVGYTKTEGADFRIRYQRDVDNVGKLTVLTTATWTNSFKDRVLPASPLVERVNASGNPLKWRGFTSVFVDRDAWTFGVTARYIDDYYADSTLPSPAYPNGLGFDGARIPSAWLFDAQIRYRIPASWSHDGGFRSWLRGTEYTLGIENVFNKEPEYRTDRFGFYSRYEKPLQRFVSLKIKKDF